jgi:hypothetical protein
MTNPEAKTNQKEQAINDLKQSIIKLIDIISKKSTDEADAIAIMASSCSISLELLKNNGEDVSREKNMLYKKIAEIYNLDTEDDVRTTSKLPNSVKLALDQENIKSILEEQQEACSTDRQYKRIIIEAWLFPI